MRDAIDAASVIDALQSEASATGSGPMGDRQLVNIFAKAEASPNGSVRGFRHTMLEDSDVNATRHAAPLLAGLLAAYREVVPCTFRAEPSIRVRLAAGP